MTEDTLPEELPENVLRGIKDLLEFSSSKEDQQKETEKVYSDYQQLPKPDQVEKLIDCKTELVFTIVGDAIEVSGDSYFSKKVFNRSYHIEVPESEDYELFMSVFFDHLEKCLERSVKQAMPKKDSSSDG